jgi:hypothetical protein
MYIFCFFERETIFHDTTITSIVSGGRRSLHFVKGGKNLAEADGADENVFVPQFFWRIFKKTRAEVLHVLARNGTSLERKTLEMRKRAKLKREIFQCNDYILVGRAYDNVRIWILNRMGFQFNQLANYIPLHTLSTFCILSFTRRLCHWSHFGNLSGSFPWQLLVQRKVTHTHTPFFHLITRVPTDPVISCRVIQLSLCRKASYYDSLLSFCSLDE